jgi:ATP-binding cassette subfamily B protein
MIFKGPISPNNPDEKLDFKKILTSFSGLPRVLKLVWSASPLLTASMAVITILSGITPLASVTISGLLLNSVVAAITIHSFTPVWMPVILQLAVGLLNLLLSTVNSMIQQLLQNRVTDRIQLLSLQKANTLDLAFFENPTFYDKLRQATNEASYRPMTMISQTFSLGQSCITLLSMLGLLFTLQWWLVLVALVIPIPSFIANTHYGMRKYRMALRQSPERRLSAYYNRVMTIDEHNKEIKLFNLGDFFINRYRELAERLYEQDKRLTTQRGIVNALWSALAVIANSSIYLYVAFQAVLGRISLGAVTQYTMATNQAGQNFQSLLSGISSTYENSLYVDALFEFLDYQPEIVSPEHPVPVPDTGDGKGLDIEFRNVSFTYPGKTQAALKNISFTLRAGESIALVGRNGAGKTTLVKLLTRLYDPDEGEILIGGHNIKEYSLEDLRAQIGVIFQDFVRYHMVARENIGLGRVNEIENQDLVAQSAQKSGADELIARLPDGYDTMLGKWFQGRDPVHHPRTDRAPVKEQAKQQHATSSRPASPLEEKPKTSNDFTPGNSGAELSGGEWQKVALARAFMRDARILVLDEPTSALDAQAEYDVFRRFRELTRGKTAVFISHRFGTVRLADHILVIENGTLIENGSHSALIELAGRYAELFNLQAEAYR